MAKNTSITLGEPYNQIIKALIKRGRFGSASETIRAGLRLLEEQEMKMETLRETLLKTED